MSGSIAREQNLIPSQPTWEAVSPVEQETHPFCFFFLFRPLNEDDKTEVPL